MDNKLERILQKVQKPARYTGGEYGQIVKDKAEVDIRIAFCFPDTYEIGMSNLGLRILYGALNGLDGVWCERVFSPWDDMEVHMRADDLPLCGLESGDPIRGFDFIAFSVGYELSYTNVLNMLDLAGIPLRAAQRKEHDPIVIAGGACCYNPEPLADFIDLFVVGEGEDVVADLIGTYRSACRDGASSGSGAGNGGSGDGSNNSGGADSSGSNHRSGVNGGRAAFLKAAPKLPGVYIPTLYDIIYDHDGSLKEITPKDGAPLPVLKRIVQELDDAYFPVNTIVPSTALIHDRSVLELFRGCIRGCRFCHAGYVNRPVRSRSCDTLIKQGVESLEKSGYDELALLSLSTSDYSRLIDLCDGLMSWCEPRRASLSLPSLRADNFSVEIMERVQKVRKSGLTFAPEAGSQRLRDVINKNVTEEELLDACRVAFEGGRNSVKLYFMLGLPTETDEDVKAIAVLARAVLDTWKRHAKNKSRGLRITVSTSCFIPKPHTPFQWEAQVTMGEYMRRVDLLRGELKTKAITYNWHEAEQSFIEAALARGDRRAGSVIETAWKDGARMDSWSEHFSLQLWLEAFEKSGIDPGFYALRERARDEKLPWGLISAGISEDHLWGEREASRSGKTTPDCGTECSGCGASGLLKGGQVCGAC